MAKREISLGKDFGDVTVTANGVSVDIYADGRVVAPAAAVPAADPALKDRILRMADQERYGILNGRRLYQVFKESQANDISLAVRELEQEKKISIKGVPHGFEVFQCVFVKNHTL